MGIASELVGGERGQPPYPGKVVAQLMGHANVDTTLNVYTQVLDGSLREAVDKVGGELFTIVHKQGQEGSETQQRIAASP